MIQRIQTVYLLLTLIISSLMFIFPFAEIQVQGEVFVYKPTGIHIADDNEKVMNGFPVLVLLIAHLLLTFISIFLYKNRILQIKLGKLNILVLLGLLVGVFYYLDMSSTAIELQYEPAQQSAVIYGMSIFLPLFSILFVFLANRAIRKDEELVRSTERLR